MSKKTVRQGVHIKYAPIPDVFLCGCPADHCSGSVQPLNASMRQGPARRVHLSPEEAFKCRAGWLISKGYERLSSREFRAPDGSGILVITKPSRFGARMRPGKQGTRNMVPKRHGNRSGVISSY